MRSAFVPLAIAMGALAPVGAAAHPADDLPPGHWMVISLNTIDDVDPCPNQDCSYSANEGVSGVVDDWNGGAFASGYGTLGGLVAWGGGHQGYYGSEIYVFDVETQLWIRQTDPYDNGGSVAGDCNDDGVYPDGSACPTHTYDRVGYHPGSNSFVILFATDDPVCGGCDDPNVHLFDFDDDTWSLNARHPSPGPMTGASSAYDEGRDVFWLLPAYNGQFAQYDPNADAWTLFEAYNIEIDAVSAIDPGRDLFVTVDGGGTGTVIVHDLTNPSAGGTTVTVDGTSPIMMSPAHGFEWDPVSEQFIGWAGGTEVYALQPPTGDWATGNWTWVRLDAASDNPVVPSDPNGNGTYSRFRYVPSLNVFIVVNGTGDQVYLYRLTDDPGSGPNDPGGDTGGSGSGGDGAGDTSAGTMSGGGSGNSAGGDGAGGSDGDSGGCSCRADRPRYGLAFLVLMLPVALSHRRRSSAPRGRTPRRACR